jgi:hypothetical protein
MFAIHDRVPLLVGFGTTKELRSGSSKNKAPVLGRPSEFATKGSIGVVQGIAQREPGRNGTGIENDWEKVFGGPSRNASNVCEGHHIGLLSKAADLSPKSEQTLDASSQASDGEQSKG